MPFISVTRLRLRSFWQLPRFLWLTVPVVSQAKKSPGNLGTDGRSGPRFTFWTRSAWKDEASMRAFMLSGAHKKAMPALSDLVDEAAVTHWQQESSALPPWNEAHQRLAANPRFTKIKYPSEDHTAGRIPQSN